jgi:hypothetical protein
MSIEQFISRITFLSFVFDNKEEEEKKIDRDRKFTR